MNHLIIELMSKSNSKKITLISLFVIVSVILCGNIYAQGNLLITPRRVVFDGTRRVMELNLANTGKDTAKYNVSLVQYRMNVDGSFTEITEPDPGQNFADKNIRFFPRTVTLGPSEAQVVKMQVVNMDKMSPGEYRSHVYFRSVPNETALGENEEIIDSTALSIKLIPIFGITIPVIIRIGENDTKVNISDLNFVKINDTLNVIDLTFNRTGKMSIYGDVKVIYVSDNGKETQVGVVNGVAVYTPNTKRSLRVELERVRNIDFSKGSIKVIFFSQSDTKPEIYAESQIKLI